MNGFNINEEDLLARYAQSRDLEIERLLTQYGSSLAEIKEMYPQISSAIGKRRLTTTLPSEPLFFTPTEARDMGLNLEEGWMLKFNPTQGDGERYSASFVTPTKWEITEDNLFISPGGERYSRADFEALLSYPTGGMAIGEEAGSLISPSLTIADLTEEGKSYYQKYQQEGGQLDINGWLDLMERQQLETEQVFGQVFPEMDIEEVRRYAEEQPESFENDIFEIGRTPETERLLQLTYEGVTPQVLDSFFGTYQSQEGIEWTTPETLGMPKVNEIFRWSLGSIWGRMKDIGIGPQSELVQEIKDKLLMSELLPEEQRNWIRDTGILPSTYMELSPEELEQIGVQLSDTSREVLRRIQTTGDKYEYWESLLTREEYTPGFTAQIQAGWGDVLRSAGSAASWLGAEGAGKWLAEKGSAYQLVVPAAEWKGVFHPNFWTKQLPRAIPFTFALIPAAIVGGYAGAGVAGAVGLGAFGKLLLGAIGASVLSRPLESALEAGNAYDEALAKGLTEEEAEEAASSTFKGNLALSGLDAAQFAMAFAPMPFKTGSRLLRYATIAGKVAVVGLSEAGEEAVQDIITRRALGEEVKMDADMQQAMALGMVMGMGLGGVGDVYSAIQNRVENNLSQPLSEVFEKTKFEGLDQGLTEQQATLRAFDVIAEMPEGKQIIQDVINRVQKAEQQKQNTAFGIGNISDTKMTVGELGLNYKNLPQEVRTRLESFKGGKESFGNYTVYNFARFINDQFTEVGGKSALFRMARNPEIQKIFAFWANDRGIFTGTEADEISKQMASQPRDAVIGNISEPTPRGTVQHPGNIKSNEAANVEIAKEYYDAIPGSELDTAATAYLREGTTDSYINRMPEYAELKLQALSDDVRTNISELTEIQNLGREEIKQLSLRLRDATTYEERQSIQSQISKLEKDITYFDGIIHKLKGGDRLSIDDAVALGMALRKTRGGKIVPAVRQSGFYVTDEFANYPYFQDVSLPSGNLMDPIRLCEAIDGGRFGGALQQNVLWPTQRSYLAYLQFVDNTKAQVHLLAEKYGLTGFGSKGAKQAAGDVVEYIGQNEVSKTAEELLSIPEIGQLVKGFNPRTQHNIVEFAKEARHFFDDMLDVQNRARAKRNQAHIPYRHNYRQWILDTNIWSMLFGRNKKPDVMMQTTLMPDYIKPDAPFNARAQAREGGLEGYLKERDLVKLMYDYSVTAGKDLFMTNIVQNGKIHAATLRSMGHENSATLIEEWISEAYAGVTPKLSRAIRSIVPMKAIKAGFWVRRQLTRAVFPLNWTWNAFVQTSSIALTITRYGMVNTIRGLEYLLVPSIRQQVRGNAYSAIIKGRRGGKAIYQDIGAGVEKSLRLEGSIMEKVENIANFLTNTIEDMLTGVSVRAAYHYGQKLGYNGRALWEYASEGGAKTQSMYNRENIPGILRNQEVGTVFPFQTFALEVFNTVREMNIIGISKLGKAGAYETISARSAQGTATINIRVKMLVRWFAAMMVINMVADKAINRKPWELSSFIPFFSIMGAGMDSDNPWYLPMPVKYVAEFKDAIEDILKYDNWTDLRQWVVRYHVLGGTQINRMWDALQSLAHGEWTDVRGKQLFEVTPDEWLTALTRGIYSTTGGREYVDKLNDKKGAWYEILGFSLPERVSLSGEIEKEYAKLGEVDEEGHIYNFGDFVSALRLMRQRVGDNRFNKADSPFIQGFLDAEIIREEFEQLPYQPIYLMDSEDWEPWLHYQALSGEEKVQFAKDNPEVLQEWGGQYYSLWKEYDALEGKQEKSQFLEEHPELTRDWRKEWRINSPKSDAMLSFWGFPGRIQTKQAYDQVVTWAKEYGIDLDHLSTWLPPENITDDYFKYLELSDQYSSNSSEVKLFRLEHPEFNQWGIDAYGWSESSLQGEDIDMLRLKVELKNLTPDTPEYKAASYKIKALENEMPQHLVDTYVDWYANPRKGYEDDWFLMENKEFYDVMVDKGIWQPRDFSKIPSRDEARLLEYYDGLDANKRLSERCQDEKLDAVLVKFKGLEPAYGTDRCKNKS